MSHADSDILSAIAVEPMTGSEIGKGFAPEHIKDRAGWGRKWLKKAAESGIVKALGDLWTAATKAAPTPPVFTGPDFTVHPMQPWVGELGTRDYKAPHANRGTMPRPHFPRAQRRIRFCNN